MKTELNIDITPEDMKAHDISNSSSGQVIDELAVACGEWDSNEMFENSFDYQPFQPYNFDYEDDCKDYTTAEQIKAWLLLSIAGDGRSIKAKRKAENKTRNLHFTGIM